MQLTIFSFVTVLLCFSVFVILVRLFLAITGYEIYIDPGLLIFFILTPLFRLVLPVEFGFSRDVFSAELYPWISRLATTHLSLGTFSVPWLHVLFFVWIVGAILRFCLVLKVCREKTECYRLIAYVSDDRFEHIFRKYRVKPVKVAETAHMDGAMTYRMGNPVIVLSKDRPSGSADSMIGHEMGHIVHGDLRIKWIVEIATSIFWWVLPVYIIRAQANNSMEIRADRFALARLSCEEREKYTKLLMNEIKRRSQPKKKVFLMNSLFWNSTLRNLKKRLRAIRLMNEKPKRLAWVTGIVVALSISFMLLSVSFVIRPTFRESGYLDIDVENVIDVEDRGYYLVKGSNGGYTMYYDGEFIGEILSDTLDGGLEDLPVYENGREGGEE